MSVISVRRGEWSRLLSTARHQRDLAVAGPTAVRALHWQAGVALCAAKPELDAKFGRQVGPITPASGQFGQRGRFTECGQRQRMVGLGAKAVGSEQQGTFEPDQGLPGLALLQPQCAERGEKGRALQALRARGFEPLQQVPARHRGRGPLRTGKEQAGTCHKGVGAIVLQGRLIGVRPMGHRNPQDERCKAHPDGPDPGRRTHASRSEVPGLKGPVGPLSDQRDQSEGSVGRLLVAVLTQLGSAGTSSAHAFGAYSVYCLLSPSRR